eukprot:2897867-Pyramimonas_sp.AAC.1
MGLRTFARPHRAHISTGWAQSSGTAADSGGSCRGRRSVRRGGQRARGRRRGGGGGGGGGGGRGEGPGGGRR